MFLRIAIFRSSVNRYNNEFGIRKAARKNCERIMTPLIPFSPPFKRAFPDGKFRGSIGMEICVFISQAKIVLKIGVQN